MLSSGLLVRDDIRSKTNGFAKLIYKDKLYVPMSFWSENDYVYLEYINQANNRIDKVFRYTMGTKAVLYKSKRVVL